MQFRGMGPPPSIPAPGRGRVVVPQQASTGVRHLWLLKHTWPRLPVRPMTFTTMASLTGLFSCSGGGQGRRGVQPVSATQRSFFQLCRAQAPHKNHWNATPGRARPAQRVSEARSWALWFGASMGPKSGPGPSFIQRHAPCWMLPDNPQ